MFAEETAIKVYDISDREILNQVSLSQNVMLKLDLNNAERGLYFMKISSENAIVIKKVVVE